MFAAPLQDLESVEKTGVLSLRFNLASRALLSRDLPLRLSRSSPSMSGKVSLKRSGEKPEDWADWKAVLLGAGPSSSNTGARMRR